MSHRLLLLALLAAPVPAAAQRAFGADGRDAQQFDESFRKYTKRFFGVGFDWQVFKAQAMAESRLDAQAHNPTGARGLMQLMPSTYRQIQTRNPEFKSIDDPEWNIAAGIQYDRTLWNLWNDHEADADRQSFTFASYNAGRGTILRAQALARQDSLDHLKWASIETVAPRGPAMAPPGDAGLSAEDPGQPRQSGGRRNAPAPLTGAGYLSRPTASRASRTAAARSTPAIP